VTLENAAVRLEHYQQVESLRSIVLVDYRVERIEVWLRSEARWTSRQYGPGETVDLEPIGCAFEVDAVYAAARDA
jgi:hypothetical protein